MSFSLGATPRQPGFVDAVQFRTFKVAHQKVTLDIDLSRHVIRGSADIILIPLTENLEYVTLDCSGIKILDVLVENRRCDNYLYDDPFRQLSKNYLANEHNDSALYKDNSIEQSQFLREKFGYLSEYPEERTKSHLTIKLPSSIKITLQDTHSLINHYTPSVRSNNTSATNSNESVFTPISVKVEYEISSPVNGIVFDTSNESDQWLWNAYTVNSEMCSTASFWMPCVNSLDEKSTWELVISVPRKVKEIGSSKIIGQNGAVETKQPDVLTPAPTPTQETKDDTNDPGTQNNEDEDDDYAEVDDEEEDEEDQENPINRDIVVCCSEFSTMKDTAHPTDLSKKTFSFQIYNPVAPHHIGWAVGAFDTYELPLVRHKEELYEEEQELEENSTINGNTSKTNNGSGNFDYNGSNSNGQGIDDMGDIEVNDVIPIQMYCLPTPDNSKSTILNSTIVCQKIMDFFSKEFGSYPFTSYSVVFLPTVPTQTMNFASFTICNTRLLYPPEIIDLIVPTTEQLAWALAVQWSGVNITPLDINDIWCCLGMAGYMVFQFWKKMFGNNDFKYKLKKCSEDIIRLDYGKPPIGLTFVNASRPISHTSGDLNFIKLKAPMVLYILDRRMTKTERSFGMSRVLPKIFLQAMSGDLPNNSLSASHFIHVCERVNKSKLEKFFDQWVYSSGVPIFRVTQKFNRKRMVVEVGIRQVQDQELGEFSKENNKTDFMRNALDYMQNPVKNIKNCFTGSMTIRIHEPDGTPYEHIVEIKDSFTKLDIQYNTKYRKPRTKKNTGTTPTTPSNPNPTTPRAGTPNPVTTTTLSTASASINAKLKKEADAMNNDANDEDFSNVQKLGNVLSSKQDTYDWNLTDISITTDGHEIQRQGEAFEWIRVDSDFEWICKLHINQPDYMFTSQLQQDSDIEAQLESIRYFEDVIENSEQNSILYSSILTRTVMDSRYFYGIRLEASKALSKFVVYETDERRFFGGSKHLIKVYQSLFCYPNSSVPKNNNFSDFQSYYLQKSIPEFLSKVKDERGETPSFVKNFLIDILAYNENSENLYDDTFFVVNLIKSAVNCALTTPGDKSYLSKLKEQLHRTKNLDSWSPSYQLLVAKTLLSQEIKLKHKISDSNQNLNQILFYTLCPEMITQNTLAPKQKEGQNDIVLLAYEIMLIEGGLKNKEALNYFFQNLCFSIDPYIKEKLADVFVSAVNFVAANGLIETYSDDIDHMIKKINSEPFTLNDKIATDIIGEDDDENDKSNPIIQGDFEQELIIKRERQMRSNISGMIALLQKQFEDYGPLKQVLWEVLHMPNPSLYQRKRLFDAARTLYILTDKFEVILPKPKQKKLVARELEANKVVIRREGLLKLTINPKSNVKLPAPNKIKLNLSAKSKKNKPKSKTKAKVKKGVVKRVGILPIRFIRISSTDRKKIDLSSVPFSETVQILKANSRSLSVKIKLPKKE